ncbi:hypothetical protein ACFLTP_07705 [Chloroflexota bacterium]
MKYPNGYYRKNVYQNEKRYALHNPLPTTWYECLACGIEYIEAAKARACCHDLKPIKDTSLTDQALTILGRKPPKRQPQPRRHYENVKHPDQWGHSNRSRYKGHDSFEWLATHYHRAQALLQDHLRRKEIKRLESLFSSYEDWEGNQYNGRPYCRPPLNNLQRMAWGYLTNNWDFIRSAMHDEIREEKAQARRDIYNELDLLNGVKRPVNPRLLVPSADEIRQIQIDLAKRLRHDKE